MLTGVLAALGFVLGWVCATLHHWHAMEQRAWREWFHDIRG